MEANISSSGRKRYAGYGAYDLYYGDDRDGCICGIRRNGRDPEESGPFGNSGTGCHDRLRRRTDSRSGDRDSAADHVPEVGLCDSGSNLRPASVRNREVFSLFHGVLEL